MPPQNKERFRTRQEGWDRVYRETPLKDIPWEEGKPSEELAGLVEEGKIEPGAVLDICCGTGTNALYLAQQGYAVSGIDISPTAVGMAREKCQNAGVRCQLEVGDATRLPYPDGSFTLVFDRGCFHHIPPQERAAFIGGIHRVLQPSGKYQLICFSAKDRWAPQSFSRQDLLDLFSPLFRILSMREFTLTERRGSRRHFHSVLMEKK